MNPMVEGIARANGKQHHNHCLTCNRHKISDQLYDWGLHTISESEFERFVK
jgi:hypothetical protein